MNTKFPQTFAPIKLYRNPLSGHCHKVELMLGLLQIPYETVEVDMANGAHKAASFLDKSPLGQVPAIDDNGVVLSDSNAILIYLSSKYNDGYAWYPSDPVKAAEVQRWLSIAAGEIAAGPCAVRLVKLFGMDLDYELAKQKTENLFDVLENHISNNTFLIGDSISLADIAAYSYVSHVPEGGIPLEPYKAIRAWLTRIEAQPNFIGMARSAIPAE